MQHLPPYLFSLVGQITCKRTALTYWKSGNYILFVGKPPLVTQPILFKNGPELHQQAIVAAGNSITSNAGPSCSTLLAKLICFQVSKIKLLR